VKLVRKEGRKQKDKETKLGRSAAKAEDKLKVDQEISSKNTVVEDALKVKTQKFQHVNDDSCEL
jgi:hypothetical protein